MHDQALNLEILQLNTMNFPNSILILWISIFIISCNQNADMASKKITKERVAIGETIEDVVPPPTNLKTTFKTVQDWLLGICNAEKPSKNIGLYSLGLFESQNDCVLFLVGLNKSDNKTTVDFKPSNMYYKVPETEYKDLDREQRIHKLTAQIKDFTTTRKFESSFLVDADSIVMEGKTVIWSK